MKSLKGMAAIETLYSGKAKTLLTTQDERCLIMHHRDDVTAFDNKKKAAFEHKGMLNNHFNAFFCDKLREEGIANHFVKRISDTDSLVKRLQMLPVECVIRNIATGGLCRRLGVKDGLVLSAPLFEFFLKNDELGDPMINEGHILAFKWATQAQIDQMKIQTQKINRVLSDIFSHAGFVLVDFKVEFGVFDGRVLLGDEITPDSCRIWDNKTLQPFDKDVFRKEIGDLVDSYRALADRLGIALPAEATA